MNLMVPMMKKNHLNKDGTLSESGKAWIKKTLDMDRITKEVVKNVRRWRAYHPAKNENGKTKL